MKNIILIILSSLCATPVFAQSTITLYGIIDSGITYVSNEAGAHALREDDGIYYGNRWGLKGTEDLGGGMAAIFQLESGFSLGTGKLGQGGAEFGRQAYVGLKNQYGAVTMGNQYDFGSEYFSFHCLGTGACVTGYGGHIGNLDGQLFGLRLDNSIKYQSPEIYGFQFGGLYSLGNVAGNFHEDSGYSVGVAYAVSALYAVAYYTRINNPSGGNSLDPYAQLGMTSLLGQTVATTNANGSISDPYSSAEFNLDSKSVYGAGAAYTIGKATGKFDIVNTEQKGYGHTSTLHVYELGGTYNFTPAFQGIFSYQYSNLESTHWNQFSAGVNYALSKRTTAYAGTDILHAHAADAVIGYSFEPSSNGNQIDVRIGLLHMF